VKCKGSKRKTTIEEATPDEVRALTEIAANIVKGNFQLDPKTIHKLRKHKHSVRNLSKKSLSHKKKKVFLVQQGGFLPILLAPVLTALGAIAGKAISSAIGL
jgi:hypothetical protein